jgi:hypothetical protein
MKDQTKMKARLTAIALALCTFAAAAVETVHIPFAGTFADGNSWDGEIIVTVPDGFAEDTGGLQVIHPFTLTLTSTNSPWPNVLDRPLAVGQTDNASMEAFRGLVISMNAYVTGGPVDYLASGLELFAVDPQHRSDAYFAQAQMHPISAVSEPSTWAMLLAGIAWGGRALRRRQAPK